MGKSRRFMDPGAEVAGIQSWFGSRLAEGGGLGRRSTHQLNYTVQKLTAGNPKKIGSL